MTLSISRDRTRRFGGHAILRGPGLASVRFVTIEDAGSKSFLDADGRWTGISTPLPVEAVCDDAEALALGPAIVDHIPTDLRILFRTAEGRVLGDVFWTDILPSRDRPTDDRPTRHAAISGVVLQQTPAKRQTTPISAADSHATSANDALLLSDASGRGHSASERWATSASTTSPSLDSGAPVSRPLLNDTPAPESARQPSGDAISAGGTQEAPTPVSDVPAAPLLSLDGTTLPGVEAPAAPADVNSQDRIDTEAPSEQIAATRDVNRDVGVFGYDVRILAASLAGLLSLVAFIAGTSILTRSPADEADIAAVARLPPKTFASQPPFDVMIPATTASQTVCSSFEDRYSQRAGMSDYEKAEIGIRAIANGCGSQAFQFLNDAILVESESASWYFARFYDPQERGDVYRRAIQPRAERAAWTYRRFRDVQRHRQALGVLCRSGALRSIDAQNRAVLCSS